VKNLPRDRRASLCFFKLANYKKETPGLLARLSMAIQVTTAAIRQDKP
jgi:hypothetical protein